jgi:hypothetical protein
MNDAEKRRREIDPGNPAQARTRCQLRSAPLVVGDKIVQGVAASFARKGGFIIAIDINSGKEVWRSNTIARRGEPGGNSWNGLPLDQRSGGSVWHQGTYDALDAATGPASIPGPGRKPSIRRRCSTSIGRR